MSKPSEKELNDWIIEHVLGWKRGRRYGNGNGEWFLPSGRIVTWNCAPTPTTDPATAMLVWKAILVRYSPVSRQRQTDKFYCITLDDVKVSEPTIELAICRFARKIFEK